MNSSRVSSAVEQRFCKPLVGSSILSPGTNKINDLTKNAHDDHAPGSTLWSTFHETSDHRPFHALAGSPLRGFITAEGLAGRLNATGLMSA